MITVQGNKSHSGLFLSNMAQLRTQHWHLLARSGNTPCAPTAYGHRNHFESCSCCGSSSSMGTSHPLKPTAPQHSVPANTSWELLYQLKSLCFETFSPLFTTSYSPLLPSLSHKTSPKSCINSMVPFLHLLLTS